MDLDWLGSLVDLNSTRRDKWIDYMHFLAHWTNYTAILSCNFNFEFQKIKANWFKIKRLKRWFLTENSWVCNVTDQINQNNDIYKSINMI